MEQKISHSQLKMEETGFNIQVIAIPKFNFEVMEPITDTESSLSVSNILSYTEEDNFLNIQLSIEIILKQSEKDVLKISALVAANITHNFEKKEMKKLLKNIGAIMYSYLRPIVALMTVIAKIPPIDLPPVKMRDIEVIQNLDC